MNPIVATKLYIPSLRPDAVRRAHLLNRLNHERDTSLILVSAAAGFGKTTLITEWATAQEHPTAWFSLDERDNNLPRFLAYLAAALQTIDDTLGRNLHAALQSPQLPSLESLLTTLINQLSAYPHDFILVLDDYHVIDAVEIHQAMSLLIEHQPPHMLLVIATREDPPLPLGRLRAHGQLTELRIKDIRFTPHETAEFLKQSMHLELSEAQITLLETRTEGWVAGLQLAALSLQGHDDATPFIESFSGSHQFVLDYLLEEVLQNLPEHIEAFLLRTAILERMCAPLCDAVLGLSPGSAQEILLYLDQVNMFIIPLDQDRTWYRYHHLFGDLLQQRMLQSGINSDELRRRASIWYEEQGLDLEAFRYAAAAHDIERAARLVEGDTMPLHFRGGAADVIQWLRSLPTAVLDERPALWVMLASAELFVTDIQHIEDRLHAAEAVIQGEGEDEQNRDLLGHIASIRATMGVVFTDVDTILEQSHRALAYLHPGNLPVRTAAHWSLAVAYDLQGDRDAASRAYQEAIATSKSIGHFIITLMSTLGLAGIQYDTNQLDLAGENYRDVIKRAGDPPLPVACAAYLGLARIAYQHNDLDAAHRHITKAKPLAAQLDTTEQPLAANLFYARLKLAQDDTEGVAALLAWADEFARAHHFHQWLPKIAELRVQMALRHDNLAEATRLVKRYDSPISQARLHLAEGDSAAALAVLNAWQTDSLPVSERLRKMALHAVAYHTDGNSAEALDVLGKALALAAPGGCIRTFIDEGPRMARLLSQAEMMPAYVTQLSNAFEAEGISVAEPLIDPLTERELEVLTLISEGLSNREIGERLFIALDTVKGHTRRIYGKLNVNRRTEAVAEARKLNIL